MRSLKFLVMLMVLFSGNAFAQSAPFFRMSYASTNVTTAAWVQLYASTPVAAVSLAIFDSSGQTLELGIGASGSEVPVLVIPPGGGGSLRTIPKGVRLSIRALSATASAGEIDINFFQY